MPFFDGHPFGLAVYDAVHGILTALGPFEVHTTKSQVAFRRRVAFAWLWMPGRWLTHPDAEVVLSFALARADTSGRLKQVVQTSTSLWIHHLEILDLDELDTEMQTWLAEAYDRAA